MKTEFYDQAKWREIHCREIEVELLHVYREEMKARQAGLDPYNLYMRRMQLSQWLSEQRLSQTRREETKP